ncbi:MAG: PAS domain-containing protein [Proteobacteria bacterium]|nr:PAS domain-containing protein [Pseudomonadota bacterium]
MNVERLRSAVTRAATVDFIDAWLRWRSDRLLPARADMNLRDIVQNLGTILLLEYLGRDNVLVRVAGTRLRELSGIGLTGRNYKDLALPDDWPLRSERITKIATRPCGGVMTVHYVLRSGRDLVFESVALPIDADVRDRPRQLLVCNTLIDGTFETATMEPSRAIPAVENFSLVDIGNGIPDQLDSSAIGS